MTRTFAHQAAPIALAALLTTAMLLATNALASHQYRVAVVAQVSTTQVAARQQDVTAVARRANA